ncbi:hypothetical protein AOL_s00054g481 [Orbilia oligospora ATCC 24927]|uniref:SprT-like domain-containing protein n=1 Tax=Arthrobotrys oligospora (strain ATCC 24927 / CBS 115.81 / DSM 1491) TaxID=756982 RepID=G1X6I7_ARTOA|nr:hypothetical protein AOL_s00054g481 [Orbilia oligospora ATCC 24927]EGX51245.1 hypothetical protein AOL_s00054g481 [Orbilia oligospora ATCC 24927]
MVRLTLNQTTHEEWLAQNSVLSSSLSSSTPQNQPDADDTTFFSCDEESIHGSELQNRSPCAVKPSSMEEKDEETDEENETNILPADTDDNILTEELQAPLTPRVQRKDDSEDEDYSEDEDVIFGSRRAPLVLGTRTPSQTQIPIAVDEDSDDNNNDNDDDSDDDDDYQNKSEDSDSSEFMPSPPPQKAKTPRTPFSVSSPTKLNRTSSKPVPAFLRRLQGIQQEVPDDQVLEEIQPSPRKQRPRISLKRDPSLAVVSSVPSLSNDEIDTLSRELGDLAVDEDHVLEQFKRPPKIVQRTSSRIFDLSDSESDLEIEIKKPSIPPPATNKTSSTPKPKTTMNPRVTSKSGKPLAPKTVERLRKKQFEESKVEISNDYLKLLDDTVNGGAVERLTAATGGIKLVWTNSKQTTAGTCQTVRYSAGLGEERTSAYFSCVITLESKVCDDVERIKETLAHEYTHACVDILEIDRRQLKSEGPHGRLFKTWAKKVGKAMNIETPDTCHNHEINYKFEYQCTLCDRIYKAHSRKPAWTTSKGCELCKVPLVQIKPVPRTAKGPTPYQTFQKETFAKLKQELPSGTPFSLAKMQKEVNRLWKEEKSRNKPGTAAADESPIKKVGGIIDIGSDSDENETSMARFEKLVITIDD